MFAERSLLLLVVALAVGNSGAAGTLKCSPAYRVPGYEGEPAVVLMDGKVTVGREHRNDGEDLQILPDMQRGAR